MGRYQHILSSLAIVSITQFAAAQGPMPVLEVKVVKVNPKCIGGSNAGELCIHDCECESSICGGDVAPTSNAVVNPGGTFIIEAFASEWSPEGEILGGFQVNFEPDSLESGESGELRIVEGDRCCDNQLACADLNASCDSGICRLEFTCGGETQSCGLMAECVDGICVGGLMNRIRGAFMDLSRPDYILFGEIALYGIDLSGPRMGALLLVPGLGIEYVPPPKYAGSIAFTVSPDASGTFAISFEETGTSGIIYEVPSELRNFLVDPALVTVIPPPCGNSICEVGEDEDTCPQDCGPQSLVPTLSSWSFVALTLLMLVLAKTQFGRRTVR